VSIEHGHVELIYDFESGQDVDGWLHAIFRYEHRTSGQLADTSFGAHIFNTAMVYRGEPQSYHGTPPGLSTKLLLRLAPAPLDAFCALIYPASQPVAAAVRHAHRAARLQGRAGRDETIEIPCGGSRLVRPSDLFATDALARAGHDGYVIVRDATCRLFGYHALTGRDGAFCLDHMFGFEARDTGFVRAPAALAALLLLSACPAPTPPIQTATPTPGTPGGVQLSRALRRRDARAGVAAASVSAMRPGAGR